MISSHGLTWRGDVGAGAVMGMSPRGRTDRRDGGIGSVAAWNLAEAPSGLPDPTWKPGSTPASAVDLHASVRPLRKAVQQRSIDAVMGECERLGTDVQVCKAADIAAVRDRTVAASQGPDRLLGICFWDEGR